MHSTAIGGPKSGGFPCRYGSCDERIFVTASDSMTALLAASALRVEHEVAAHDYRHKAFDAGTAPPFTNYQARRRKGLATA